MKPPKLTAVHVQPAGRRWIVRGNDRQRADSVHEERESALLAAKDEALRRALEWSRRIGGWPPVFVFLHRPDGKLEWHFNRATADDAILIGCRIDFGGLAYAGPDGKPEKRYIANLSPRAIAVLQEAGMLGKEILDA